MKANLALTLPDLVSLPSGAVFSEKSGRAGVSVQRDNDTIRITATCDSLQTLMEYYEREITRISSNALNEQKEERSETSSNVFSPFKIITIGFIAGIIITIILLIKLKK
jgi:hypothetical protein